jgi:hypothetical protein
MGIDAGAELEGECDADRMRPADLGPVLAEDDL